MDVLRDVIARWDQPAPAHAALLREAGVTVVVTTTRSEPFDRACRDAGISPVLESEFDFRPASKLDQPAAKPVVLSEGLWPGIQGQPARGRREVEVASASADPWVDHNGFRVSYLRALYPGRPALVGYKADKESGLGPDRVVPFDTLELALLEARTAGGNYVLSIDPRFRQQLLRGDASARAAWKRVGTAAAWANQHQRLFTAPVFPEITELVENGEETLELANLMIRRNASPLLVNAANPPAPSPRCLTLVAANLRTPPPPLRKRILAHAEAGASVVVAAAAADPWWESPALKRIRQDEDRDHFSLGKGRIIAYHDGIADPSEFALDVIDITTHRRRPVRIWNAPSAVAVATQTAGGAVLQLLNYGSPVDQDIQARIQGRFTKATLLRPEATSLELKTSPRGTTTEVQIPALVRCAVVTFS
jgi:hypothetical protein